MVTDSHWLLSTMRGVASRSVSCHGYRLLLVLYLSDNQQMDDFVSSVVFLHRRRLFQFVDCPFGVREQVAKRFHIVLFPKLRRLKLTHSFTF